MRGVERAVWRLGTLGQWCLRTGKPAVALGLLALARATPRPHRQACATLFTFPETGAQLRTVQIDGNPWFVAADVCRALGMDTTRGVFQWIRGVSDTEKRLIARREHPEIFSGTSAPSATILSESGLYKLILRAHPDRNPAVRKFQDWATRDVLPAIRKDGVYVRGEEMLKPGVVEQLDLDDLNAVRDQIERLMNRKAELLEAALEAEKAPAVAEDWRCFRTCSNSSGVVQS